MKTNKQRIFIVDDEVSITRLLKANLEQTEDYTVQVENSPLRALSAAEAFQPDLIMLDVLMPGMDGGNLAACMQTNRKLKHVPIVFLTAAAKKEEVTAHGGRIGGLRFLAKPVDFSEVIECIEEHLGKPRMEMRDVPVP